MDDLKNDDGTFAAEKEFVYTISEVVPDDAKTVNGKKVKNGITYDESTHSVTVKIENLGNGNLSTTIKYDDTGANTGALFTNTYDAAGSLTLSGKKTIDGKPDGMDLSGFKFTVKKGDDVVATGSSEVDGTISFTEIPYTLADKGKQYEYSVSEDTDTKPGVTNTTSTVTVTVSVTDNGDGTMKASAMDNSPAAINAVNFTNTYRDFLVNKTEVGDHSKEVNGAKIEIFAADANGNATGSALDSWVSKAGEVHDFGQVLEAGKKYVLVETVAPDGYTYASNIPVEVTADGTIACGAPKTTDANGKTVYLVEDALTSVNVSKTDVTDATNKEIGGATIQIIEKSTGKVVQEWKSEEGKTHTVTGLKLDTDYVLHETVAPTGYTITTDTEFKINKDGSIDKKNTKQNDNGDLLVQDAKTVSVSKVDIGTGEELTGAHIQVLDKDGKVIDEWDSEKGVKHDVKNVKVGETYTLRETVAPTGYTITTDTTFSVDKNGKVTGTTTISKDGTLLVEDAKTISVSKVDLGNGEELTGAHIQVLDKDGKVIDEWDSEKGVKHDVKNVKVGETYTLRETVAPTGYSITTDTTFTIDKNGKVTGTVSISSDGTVLVEDTLTNVKVHKVELDNTGKRVGLAGATLQLIDPSGKVMEEWVSTTEVKSFSGLVAGTTYTIHEKEEPLGYEQEPHGDIKFIVNADGSTTITNNTGDKEADGTIQILNAQLGFLWGNFYPDRYPDLVGETTGTEKQTETEKKKKEKQTETEKKTEKSTQPAPAGSAVRTGDETPIMLWVSILVLAMAAIGFVLFKKRRYGSR